MKKNYTSAGYIMVLTITMVAVLTTLITYMVTRVQTYYPASKHAQANMQAHLLALGGVQIGMAQLFDFIMEKESKEQGAKTEKKANPADQWKLFLEKFLPKLNVWQTFDLKRNIEGIDGTIKICLGSEEGKLDINQLWDFKNNSFFFEKDENKKKLYEELFNRMNKLGKASDLFASFQKFFKNRGYLMNDVSELLLIKEYKVFVENLFYEPDKKEPLIYLTDIFTIWTGKKTIDPWLFSASWQNILELKHEKKKDLKEVLKQFKPTIKWSTEWDKTLALIYEKNLNTLPKNIDSLFADTFEPKIFSVLCQGIFEKTTSNLLAIIELTKTRTQDSEQKIEVKIRKLYRL